MTTAAITLLLLTALATPTWALATRKKRNHAPVSVVRRLDVIGAVVLLVLAGVTAVLAAVAAPASGFLASAVPVVAALAAVTGGGPVVRTVLVAGGVGQRPGPGPDPEGSPDDGTGDDTDTPDSPAPAPTDPTEAGPLRGGRVIGYLERLAVVTTLMAGWPEGLAIILAVKSLARYPELRAPHAAEQFIMGTFASVMWAVGMAGVEHLIR
ncbi:MULTISPECIES: hypothetical protein [unclassified Gordonia (in: high G+C Gram-positive bacteria)]|uniref:hypothetical protein n=1 Tax=unclassified Gordonia (in: high G+C Gram-positive bacteria) TaxID=2657482 RepID=UPI00071C3384|nr:MULTISPECIES: hypothetical protein [unclassified Gordonia (in: high G+C Gram-positive bacteria)]KSU60050.1 hypothetical protein AS181_04455 [Gordonia sp. SGD-V-85]SCB92956.1 hypothetical protein GA0061091_103106 [Gordonia sp. v-85]